MILGMMVLPLPAFLLDMMFTFNIALSVMVLLVSIHTLKPLDFAVFPTVLLLTTLPPVVTQCRLDPDCAHGRARRPGGGRKGD